MPSEVAQVASEAVVRRLTLADLPTAMALQSEVYPAFLCEVERAFASRLDVAQPYCLAATLEDRLAGYLLAHGWPPHAPPPIGTILPRATAGEVLFIHDLAVGAAGRGQGIGTKLIARAFQMAVRDRLRQAELVAVEGAADYWRIQGFAAEATSSALSEIVARYGSEARFMTRKLTPIDAEG